MYYKQAVGLEGETLAKNYLIKEGYKILAQNVRYQNLGELDIVASRGGTIVFVEVKTRSNTNFGNPLEAMTQSKISRIIKSSGRYLSENDFRGYGYRYDVIGILQGEIEHIENAFYRKW